jgi:hypothetical protein
MCIMQITKNQNYYFLPLIKKERNQKSFVKNVYMEIVIKSFWTTFLLQSAFMCHSILSTWKQSSNCMFVSTCVCSTTDDPRNLAVKFSFHYLMVKNCSLVHCGSVVRTKFNIYGLTCQIHVCCNLIHANSWHARTYRAFICDVLLIWISLGPAWNYPVFKKLVYEN